MNTGFLKIVRNLFLEKEELNRFYNFIQKRLNVFIQKNANSYGILDNTSFEVQVGTNPGTIKFTSESYAITSNLDYICQQIEDNISTSTLNNTGSIYYWLKIGYAQTSFEYGTVDVDINGNMTGVGTLFLDVIRGQSAKAPSKVTLYENNVKLGEYEVISVENNTVATISSFFTTGKTGLKYAVAGTFTLGETIPSVNKNIFEYDSVVYTWVQETTVDEAPAGLDTDNEFYIARVLKNGTSLTIQDKRDNYYFRLNGEADAYDALKPSNNLSDVDDVATARENLDVLSPDEIDDAWDEKWKAQISKDTTIRGNWTFDYFTKCFYIRGRNNTHNYGITPETNPTVFVQVVNDALNKKAGIIIQPYQNENYFRHLMFLNRYGVAIGQVQQNDNNKLIFTGLEHETDTLSFIESVNSSFDNYSINTFTITRTGARTAYITAEIEAQVDLTIPVRIGFMVMDSVFNVIESKTYIVGRAELRTAPGSVALQNAKPAEFVINRDVITVYLYDGESFNNDEYYYFRFSGQVYLAEDYGDLIIE